MMELVIVCYATLIGSAMDVESLRDEPFAQEIQTTFDVSHGLDSEEVMAVAVSADGNVYAATANALFVLDRKHWKPVKAPGFPIRFLLAEPDILWAVGSNKAARLEKGKWQTYAIPDDLVVNAVSSANGNVYLGTDKGIYAIAEQGAVQIIEWKRPIRALALFGDSLFFGTDSGLFRSEGTPSKNTFQSPSEVFPEDATYGWSVRKVGALTVVNGRLWFGAENGAGMWDGHTWRLFTGKEGLPYNHFTCAAPGEDGAVWFGTENGAMRYDGTRWAYRAFRRWLPDNRVNAIAVDSQGTAWIATPKGISRIERRPMTLAEKAAHFEQIIDERHTRLGFVVRCEFEKEGDVSKSRIHPTDNDGLYTAMYGASQAFRYAATKDPVAKERAKRCFQAVKWLVDITGIPGFPARAILPVKGNQDPNIGFGEKENLAMQKTDPLWKNIVPRWPKSADGKYWWKCDTSSDEMCGHYFFYGVYYDLVAETPAEKQEVIDLVRAVTNHIVDHNFNLVDHDGKPTRWGRWSPEYLHSLDGWADRGLQAVEILSFLNVAYHITGDNKFADAAKYLRDTHAYHADAILGRCVFPPDFVVPWDNNLAFLSWYGLLKYEKDAALLDYYRTGLYRNWLFVSGQRDPFFNFVFAGVYPDRERPVWEDVKPDFPPIIADAVSTLRGTPWMLLGWEMKNSHRLDVVLDRTPGQRNVYGGSVLGGALPIEERCHIRINSDHFDLDHSQGGGSCEYEGTFFLLPYYLGRYHGFIR
ncbi:MAG TPA: two-component regulator propeller domain-containing protein [Candidatus Hydrogenedentes bacterium]|nr:two-component regulator propeller domain-containing protein [Candidatus Hydrogenedentota bacterium]HOL76413.1 two-component regulator propeller domain-containing protein [Candidatus Hydrogenedentota bacterium]HPO85451.1 two-component regulator propeller domain-containing protein [Candidatus Hydrogenedentota bacterium]